MVRTPTGGLRPCSEVIEEWAPGVTGDIYMLSLPDPMAHLLAHGRWNVIALVEGVHIQGPGALKHFRLDPMAAVQAQPAEVAAPALHILHPDRFRLAAALLRGGSVDGNALGASVQDIIAWLDSLGDLAEQGPDAVVTTPTGGSHYRVEALIEGVLLADLLRNGCCRDPGA